MEDLTEYLDESLKPLEDKIKQYLEAERNIRLLEVDVLSLQHQQAEHAQSQLTEKEQQLEKLVQRYQQLRQEVIALLPGKNIEVEINLGYGPSMVGYFSVDPDTEQPLDEPVLRVVH